MHEFLRGFGDVAGFTVVGLQNVKFLAALLLQGLTQGIADRFAIAIGLHQNPNAVEIAALGQNLDELVDLLLVGGANIDDVLQAGLAEKLGPGDGANKWNTGAARHHFHHLGWGSPDRAQNSEYTVLSHQFADVRERPLWIIAIIGTLQPQLASADTPLRIDFGEGELQPVTHAGAQCGHRAGKRCRLGEDHLIPGHPGLGLDTGREVIGAGAQQPYILANSSHHVIDLRHLGGCVLGDLGDVVIGGILLGHSRSNNLAVLIDGLD